MKFIPALVAAICCHVAFADATADQVFEQGKADAKAQANAAKTLVNSGSLAAVPEADKGVDTSQYAGKTPSQLGGMGVDKVAMCTSNPPTDKAGAAECKAILDARGNKATRPVFVIDKTTDPTIVAGNKINQDPYSVVGTSATQASACVERKEYAPSTTETFTCSEYKLPTRQVCRDTLNITVSSTPFYIFPELSLPAVPEVTTLTKSIEFNLEENDEVVSIMLDMGGDNLTALFLNPEKKPDDSIIAENTEWCDMAAEGNWSCFGTPGDPRPKWLIDGTPRLMYMSDGPYYIHRNINMGTSLPFNRGSKPNILYLSTYNEYGPGWGYAILRITVNRRTINETWENQCEYIQ